MKRGIIAILLGLLTGTCFAAGSTDAITADEIIARANHLALYQGMDSKGNVSMTIKDKNGRVRMREFNMLRKNGDDSDGDQKYYTIFQRPADVRKMVFMVHKHAALERDDDRWLYMPGLDMVKRIAAGDKRTSFAGSDFLYEDISGRRPADDQHLLLQTTPTQYIIKNTPKQPASVEFAYYLAHIDRRSFLPMKMAFFKDGDKPYRIIEVLKVESIQAEENGQTVTYPTVTVSVARDLENQSQTEMVFSNIQYNVGLGENLFSERFLRRPPRDAMR
jgi:hypothetical protein